MDFVWKSVPIRLLPRWTCTFGKGRLWCEDFEYSCVNLIVGWMSLNDVGKFEDCLLLLKS